MPSNLHLHEFNAGPMKKLQSWSPRELRPVRQFIGVASLVCSVCRQIWKIWYHVAPGIQLAPRSEIFPRGVTLKVTPNHLFSMCRLSRSSNELAIVYCEALCKGLHKGLDITDSMELIDGLVHENHVGCCQLPCSSHSNILRHRGLPSLNFVP